jgi:hypothetical protein
MFWIDSDILIRAKNEAYAFDIAPGFWEIIKRNANAGKLACSTLVYDEIARGGDELTKWANGERKTKLFIDPDEGTQRIVTDLVNYINKNYEAPQAAFFLKGADVWVIAAALNDQGIVTTHEVLVGPESKRVKIPNICRKFGVQYTDCYGMLRQLKETLHHK